MTRSLFVLLVAGCGMAGPAEGSPDALSRVDVRGTATSIAMIAQDVQDLSPERKARAAESLRILSVSCPYTRSALQLPIALHQGVMGIPPAQLDPFIQGDWETLQAGLTTHVAVLHALGVDLPVPGVGDPLHGSDPRAMIDRDTLRAADDPLGVTSLLIQEITALAEGIDAPTRDLIDLHSERVETATGVGRPCPRGPWAVLPGQPWTLGMQLGGWHDALRRVEPFVEDPGVHAQIEAMLELLVIHGEANFVSRAPEPTP